MEHLKMPGELLRQRKTLKPDGFKAFYGKQHPFRYRHLCILSEGVTIMHDHEFAY